MKRILIIGATSAIAGETAKMFAPTGTWFFLAGRNPEKLAIVAADLRVRGAARVELLSLDLNRLDLHEDLLKTAIGALGGLDAVLIAHGTLADQQLCEQSVEETMKELTTNCLSVLSLVTLIANYFEQQRRGCIAVISSVAGDRGRQSNYVYGAAKGAVSIFLQGLRNRLSKAGVKVITIKPGLVDTPMTAHVRKHFLSASARDVGETIYDAMLKGKEIVYVPWFWRWIMATIKIIPEAVFKRMNL